MRKCNLTSQRLLIRDFKKNKPAILPLFGVYKDTIDPTLVADQFMHMYVSKDLVLIDVTVFYAEKKRAGFSAAFFYSSEISNKKVYIARSATGLLEEFQGKGYHDKFDLYSKFIRFAITHPLTKLFVTAFVINPFVFSELCKFVPKFYPRPGKPVLETADRFMNEIINKSGHTRSQTYVYSVKVPIQVSFNDKLLERIYSSTDKNVRWYLEKNVGFRNMYGLLTVIEVSALNILGTLLKIAQSFWIKYLTSKPAKQ